MRSMKRPSRRTRLSATTMLKKGRALAPPRESNFKNKRIRFHLEKFEKVIGNKISSTEIKKILNNLGFKFKEKKMYTQ